MLLLRDGPKQIAKIESSESDAPLEYTHVQVGVVQYVPLRNFHEGAKFRTCLQALLKKVSSQRVQYHVYPSSSSCVEDFRKKFGIVGIEYVLCSDAEAVY